MEGKLAKVRAAREGPGAASVSCEAKWRGLVGKKIVVLAAILGLLVFGPAHAENVSGARVLEQGIYSAQLKTEEKSGKTISTGYKLIKRGNVIVSSDYEVSQFDDGLPRVGFWWYLDGSPVGTNVKIKVIRMHPDGTSDTSFWDRTLGKKTWNGVRVMDWKDVIGTNRFEVWYGDRKLTEANFEVK